MKVQGLFLFTLLIGFSFSGFSQNPCVQATPVRIVVLGSSTAAGTGPIPRDSSWVNRYRDHLKSINPANEVINLAVGGFVTYRIMPDDFVAPVAGRPAPDTAHNMTKALYHQPDGIIINLPSNDRQFPMAEQLSNFDSLFRHANSHGVPVWICTTQPIANSGPYQAAVKDSIIARFSPFVIDFWTTLADTANLVYPIYAADAVHLNNLGHWILLTRVIQKDLPTLLYQPVPFPDLNVTDISVWVQNRCGDSAAIIQVAYTNLGSATTDSLPFFLQISHLPTAGLINLQQTRLNGIGNCVTDTLTFQADLSEKGKYDLLFFHAYTGDSLAANDSLAIQIQLLGFPDLQLIGDTACFSGATTLKAIADPKDHIRWYDSVINGTNLGAGTTFQTPPISATTTFYAEAIRGDLTYNNSLQTTTTSNVNWNGAMFDLVIKDTLSIDSLELKVADLGPQRVNAFYKMGSHLGYELNAAAWSSWGNDSVVVVHADSFVTANFGKLNFLPGDTVGVYLQINDAAARLSYRSNGQTLTVSTPELSIICGSGASYNFGGNFYPRQWNGRVFYSYGERPDGDCRTDRLPVEAVLQQPPVLELGIDTIGCDSVLLDPGLSNSVRYRWSTGDTSASVWVKQQGVYWVQVENACGNAIDAVFVEMDSVPTIGFDVVYTGSLIVLLNNTSTMARRYVWYFGDGDSSTIYSPVHTYSLNRTYPVTLRIENGCDTLTLTQDVEFILDKLEEGFEKAKISVSPNPTQTQFSVELASKPIGKPAFWLTDLNGRHLGAVTPSQSSGNRFDFDLSKQLPAGVYILHMQDKRSYGNSVLVKR